MVSNVWENNVLLIKADELAHGVCGVAKNFPRNEQFGVVSQIRRAALSIILNCIEGYSRFRNKEHIRFLEISFGSAKEVHYLLDFCYKERYLKKANYCELVDLCNEVEKMLYSKIKTVRRKK